MDVINIERIVCRDVPFACQIALSILLCGICGCWKETDVASGGIKEMLERDSQGKVIRYERRVDGKLDGPYIWTTTEGIRTEGMWRGDARIGYWYEFWRSGAIKSCTVHWIPGHLGTNLLSVDDGTFWDTRGVVLGKVISGNGVEVKCDLDGRPDVLCSVSTSRDTPGFGVRWYSSNTVLRTKSGHVISHTNGRDMHYLLADRERKYLESLRWGMGTGEFYSVIWYANGRIKEIEERRMGAEGILWSFTYCGEVKQKTQMAPKFLEGMPIIIPESESGRIVFRNAVVFSNGITREIALCDVPALWKTSNHSTNKTVEFLNAPTVWLGDIINISH